MAAASAVQSLRDEVTCSVCLELFTDPVMILGCGHNFCRACIAQCWEGAETDVTCPQCRQTFAQRLLGPNRQLGNLVEVVKGLSVGSAEGAWGRMVCEQHGEALKLFCETDQVLMCVICRESRAHRAHPAAPIQEAAQQCKEQIQTQLQLLNGERERLEALRGSESQKHEEYQQKAAAERQKIVAAFERLRRFLKEQERLVLAELGEVESGIEKSQGETVTQLSEEISHVTNLIRELEGKCQQAASDLLQDMRSTLSRCRKEPFQLPEGICPELETRLSILSGQTLALQETLKKFQETLPSTLEKGKRLPEGSYTKATVTLDADTANPYLVLSADRRSVRWTNKRQQLPDNPERFYVNVCVLGREGFTSGRHCWEAEVEVRQGAWAVGVARESVRRKGGIRFSPEDWIWAVEGCGDRVWALTAPARTRLSLHRAPRRVRVCLDCAGGQVSFLDADTEAPIFTFPPASFAGDRIRPWFSLWVSGPGSELRLCH
ncbi:zinc finger protein RFP-like isoform X1 [Alligator mississippiensis]|uniref:zinc finger protein RFP-like isoform X1 n=1 Tax=Alligator mississippiensis TaxID=8496 RepID=UPI002877E8EF|nr:zinc finger protein RFP-like isoform X1 [Alligator mississippiensis]